MKFLDWRDSSHYDRHPLPCVSCGVTTPLRNDSGQPQHKVCAERELENREGRES